MLLGFAGCTRYGEPTDTAHNRHGVYYHYEKKNGVWVKNGVWEKDGTLFGRWVKPNVDAANKKPSYRLTTRTASSFYGMKFEDVMKIMGQPRESSPWEGRSSDLRMEFLGWVLSYGGEKGKETWFVLDNKYLVIGGAYKGVNITKPGEKP